MNKRRDETLSVRLKHTLLDLAPFIVIGFAGLSLAVASYVSKMGTEFQWSNFVDEFGVDLSLELLSIAFTVIVIDRLVRQREQRDTRARERLSELNRLIDLLKSEPPERTHQIVEELYDEGFLLNGDMRGIYLRDVEMPNAQLGNSDLEDCKLINANLSGAILDRANLRQTKLMGTNFQHARLINANLSEANLRAADLSYADLSGCNLENVIMDHDTILPNGDHYAPGYNILQFAQ